LQERQEVQELLCNPLRAWTRNHSTMLIAEPKAHGRAGTRYSQVLTPPLIYRSQLIGNVAAANQAKRLKKAKAALQTPNPLDGLHNWLEYVDEDRKPVINIHAWPKLHEKFLSAFSRAVAAANGQAAGPAQMKFKGDFQHMRLLCNDKEIEPIQPGKVAYAYNVSNRIVQVTDATYEGFYTYPADAISPSCKVELLIESAEKPDKPRYIELNRKLVQQVWDDFVPHFNSPHRTQP
jgi:hypothetical protein